MSRLLERVEVPLNVRKNARMCPQTVEIFDDHVSCIGGQGGSWFYKDFTGASIQVASAGCAFASVILLNPVSGANNIKVGANMLQDRNRINFLSGMFSYAPANDFAKKLCFKIQKAMEDYKSKPQVMGTTVLNNEVSTADELRKFKELLDMGAITQEEFDTKKKQLLGVASNNNALGNTPISKQPIESGSVARFCQKCGKQNSSNYIFCVNCGEKLL